MSISLFNLIGKVALVNDAAHGLGMSMSKGLGNAGATTVLNNHTKDALDEVIKKHRDCGLNVCGNLFDVTDNKAVEVAITKIESEVGPFIISNDGGILSTIGKPSNQN